MRRATTEEFAKAGYDVAMLSRDPDRFDRAADKLQNTYVVRTMPIPADVADAEAVVKAASDVEVGRLQEEAVAVNLTRRLRIRARWH